MRMSVTAVSQRGSSRPENMKTDLLQTLANVPDFFYVDVHVCQLCKFSTS